jgi:hypothetical protein
MLETCAVQERLLINPTSLAKLSVVARCDCGCDTVDFESINWSDPPAVVADGQGTSKNGDSVGLIVFGRRDRVVCLEVYNHKPGPAKLPVLDSIKPYGTPKSVF